MNMPLVLLNRWRRLRSSTFSPSSLFAASEPGVWYDPSDLTTLFQDTAGTTPVTATGQTVGRMLDKSGRGNHATQATTASRPIYGINPITGTRNLLLATDTMSTQSRTVTAAAHTLSFTGTGTVTLTGASIAGPLAGTGAGNRVSLTFTPTAGSLTMTVVGSVTFAQLELGSTATAYQRVTDQYNVTEAGVASAHYLRFDGTDDFMLTNTITPAIDKAQVFAGVRKLATASYPVIVELSATANENNGSFGVFASSPINTIDRFGQILRGTAEISSDVPGGNHTVPRTVVLASQFDISQATPSTESTLRVDAQPVSLNHRGTNAGTGNFLAYPLYIGRRAATSFPFNGQLYSLIVRFGANLTTDTITSTETYVNGKTGAYA